MIYTSAGPPERGLVFDAYLPNQNLPVRINSIDIAHISISINMLCQCCPLQKQRKKKLYVDNLKTKNLKMKE